MFRLPAGEMALCMNKPLGVVPVTSLDAWQPFDNLDVHTVVAGLSLCDALDIPKRFDVVPPAADESATAHDRLEAKQAQQLVELALATLPDERRQVFVMHDLEGLIAADIAELIGCPLQTVYSRLRVARTEFTQAVRRIQLKRGEA